MAVDSKHPLYSEHVDDWIQLRDTFKGERRIKEKGALYLPYTPGQLEDGAGTKGHADGEKHYRSYKRRAVFPEIVGEAVEAMLGVLHNKPPVIELPEALEPLREKATLRNESLDALLRRINEEQLVMGRLGLLLEPPDGAAGVVPPRIALYQTESIINWDSGTRQDPELEKLNLVVIDETGPERIDRFEWKDVEKYRVLVFGEILENEGEGEGGAYRVALVRESKSFAEEDLIEPSIAGVTLDEIPFVFINTKDIGSDPDDGPLLGLSNLCLTIYRGEADYRQALFNQGQDTFITIGAIVDDGETTRVGAGARIDLPLGGDAKYVGVDSGGLPEMRTALENDYTRAQERAGSLLEAVSRAAESGEALRVRVAARTASLNQIALTGAFGLQELLRIAARWVGANPDEVIVTPNLDFVGETLAGKTLVELMTAKQLSAPISLQSIHALMSAKGLTELTWDEELEQLQAEGEDGLPGAKLPGEDEDEGTTDLGGPDPTDPMNDPKMDPND